MNPLRLDSIPMTARLLPTLCVFFLLFQMGCHRQLMLSLESSQCLNPPDYYCDETGENSRILEVSIYQLKAPVDPNGLSWSDFLEPGLDLETLGSTLTDPENPTIVKRQFTLKRGEQKNHKIRRLLKTQYLLIATTGRHEGDTPIIMVPIGWLQREQKLCFEYYDVSVPVVEELGRFSRYFHSTGPCQFTF